MRRTLLTLTLLAGGQALAQDGAGGGRAVRISGGAWTELDAAAEAGFLTQYQYAQGVSVLPTPQGLWRETLPPGALDGADLLLVDAEDSSAQELDEGVPLEDVLRHVVGSEGDVLSPADTGGDELKPQVRQLVLVLPAGTLAALFPEGGAAEVESILHLEPRRLLDVRPETPCEDKCAWPLEATQVVATSVDSGAELPLPERVLANEPPDTAPQPLLNRGGIWIAPVAESEAGTLVRAEAGSGADLYQWSVLHADGQRWSLGVTTTSAVEFTLPADLAQDNALSLSVSAFTWDTSRQTWAAKAAPKPYPGGGGGGGSISYVGVIPNAAGCPNPADLLTFNMDDEDKKNANSRGGWIGGITSNNNTTWRFCRVDASKFKPLSKDSLRQNHYAVLMLGGSCPTGSLRFSRYFDNEDKNNANWASANFVWAPNSSDRNTNLVFCVFRGAGASGATMSDMPNLGFSYGVLAASDFSKRLATGWVHTDDEDSNNQNSYGDPHGQYGDVSRFITVGSNTTVNLVKVR
ncbi:hypothetical protein JY651_27775 [Pyxidicoccus parkwayensis]|uniref:Uncharacterized protein n=1 Tax=Pyxidicoccus parkwayensis TaxID=2813578 RepID=A0ABX7NK37_9BACT|nr:hypothetical protein [Pyxidicoccus parkwaysis]QSQ19145.1 hypothetical protein JY651_27775 [Pyxidicoccus parkwaysis]